MLGRAALQVAVQASIQLPALQRLTDELVHPGVEATLAVLGQHMGGHRDDGHGLQLLFRFQFTDLAAGLETVQLGHFAVHQDQLNGVRIAAVEIHGLAAVVGELHGVAAFLQQAAHHHLVHRIVFGDEDAGFALRLRR